MDFNFYYLLIIIATVLFSCQFMMTQGFQKLNGSSFKTSIRFASQTSLVICLAMFILSGFKLTFTPLLVIVALCHSIMAFTASYCSIKALGTANLSVYSMFSMLGGMLLPFVYGIVFGGEEMTWGKGICCVLIVAALSFDRESFKSKAGAIKYYLAVFFLNGMNGVIAAFITWAEPGYNKQSYLALMNMFVFIITFVAYYITQKKLPIPRPAELKYTVSYGVCNGAANLMLLIALGHVNASVQYPIVTGGVIIFSTVAAALQKDNVKRRTVISAIIAFVATVCIIL